MKSLKDFINNFDADKGKPVYLYRMIFFGINEKQRNYLIDHLSDYSGGSGLAIVKLTVSDMPKVRLPNNPNNEANIIFDLVSSKDFLDMLPVMLGKERFLSNIFYDDRGLRKKTVRFYLENGTEYDVEISKYGGITNMSTQQDDTVETRLKTRQGAY